MGFWHTGYIEHHEFSGMVNDEECTVSRVILCDKCGKKFLTSEELQNHIFSEHKSRLPKLLIEGYEAHGELNRIITKKLSISDIALYNCKDVIVNNVMNISDPKELINIINTEKRGIVRISLISEDRIINNIKLIINIASLEEIEKVEKVFWEIQGGKKLNREIIEKFIKASAKYKTVSRYYNGICQYLYGVLAKERSKETGLDYSEYEKKFESALSDLKFYRSNLSNLIRGLIFFNFNKFINANILCPNLRLGYAANNLGDACIWKSNFIHTEDSVLSDRTTEKLIQLSTLSIKEFGNRLPYILTLIKDKYLSQIDHIKIAILLAKYYYINEDVENFKKQIRYLKNFPEFGYITKYLTLPAIGGD